MKTCSHLKLVWSEYQDHDSENTYYTAFSRVYGLSEDDPMVWRLAPVLYQNAVFWTLGDSDEELYGALSGTYFDSVVVAKEAAQDMEDSVMEAMARHDTN